jgi:fucose 4-O-acetylase-like acetyltransferase
VSLSPAALAKATAADRDRYVDFVRVASICAVIVGHWLLALLTLYGAGNLSHRVPFELVTWAMQVMPLFFAVGGFAHAHALASLRRRDGTYGDFLRARNARLLPPILLFLAVWAVFASVLELAGWERGPIDLATDRVTTPLWFIGIYLLVVLFAPPMEAWYRRHGWGSFFALAAAAVALDVLRFRYGQSWAGIVNLLVVWLAVHQVGFFWSDGRLTRRGLPLVGAVLGFGLTLWLTLGTHWYPVLMVGLPGNSDSNMAPPDVALLTHAVGLIGLVLLIRRPLERLLQRPRAWAGVVFGNTVIMTLFCWHLTAAFLIQGLLLLLGIRPPPAGTAAWWALLPVWLLSCVVPLVLLVAVFRRAERVPVPGAGAHNVAATTVAATGGVLAALGIFVVSQVGLDGLLVGRPERVWALSLPAWPGLAALAVGLLLLRTPTTATRREPAS